MKIEFVPVNARVDVQIPSSALKKLPEKIALFVTSQLYTQFEKIKNQLESAEKKVLIVQTRHTPREGQILGCNIEDYEVRGEFDAFFYVGDGEFHPKALLFRNTKPVFVYNPLENQFFEMDREEAERAVKRRKGALLKFYTSKNIGVMVTGKSGQNMIHKALKFKFKDKKFFIFVANTFNFQELNDFPFIDVWINTACPRIAYEDLEKLDQPIINFEEIPELGFSPDENKIPVVPGKVEKFKSI